MQHADHVVQLVEGRLELVRSPGVPRANPVIAGGDQGLVGARFQLVARELFLEEAIVGLAGIQRTDDIVAVAPCMRPKLIGVGTAL